MVDSREAESAAEMSEKALRLAFPNGSSRSLKTPLPGFDSIDTALQDFADGKFVIVLDNEDRENEGDLIMAADKVTFCILRHHRKHLPSTFYHSVAVQKQE